MSSTLAPKQYAVLAPGGSLSTVRGYHILANDGVLTQHQGYAIGSMASAYAAGVASDQSYAILTNPAAVTAQSGNVVARHDVAILSTRGYVVMQTFYPPYVDLNLEYPFAEKQFPTTVSYGSSGGPGFKTSIFSVDSGVVHANAEWERLRARYTVEFDHCPQEDIEAVEDFFYSMRGKAIGFRYKDWQDYQISKHNVVVGDGNSVSFQLFKRYRSGAHTFDRMIRKPVRGTVSSLYLDGVEQVLDRDFFVNYSTGEITFVTPPAAGAVGYLEYCEFDVPVRFDTDRLTVSAEDFNQYSIGSLDLIEILV